MHRNNFKLLRLNNSCLNQDFARCCHKNRLKGIEYNYLTLWPFRDNAYNENCWLTITSSDLITVIRVLLDILKIVPYWCKYYNEREPQVIEWNLIAVNTHLTRFSLQLLWSFELKNHDCKFLFSTGVLNIICVWISM